MSHKYIDLLTDAATESLFQEFYNKNGRDMTALEEKEFITEIAIWNRAEAMAQEYSPDNGDNEYA